MNYIVTRRTKDGSIISENDLHKMNYSNKELENLFSKICRRMESSESSP